TLTFSPARGAGDTTTWTACPGATDERWIPSGHVRPPGGGDHLSRRGQDVPGHHAGRVPGAAGRRIGCVQREPQCRGGRGVPAAPADRRGHGWNRAPTGNPARPGPDPRGT